MHTVPHRAPSSQSNGTDREAHSVTACQHDWRRPTIFSGDPDSVRKLRDRIVGLEKDHLNMMIGSEALREWDDCKLWRVLHLSSEESAKLKGSDRGLVHVDACTIKNLGANIRRLKKRLDIIERTRAMGTQERKYSNGVRLVDNVEAFKAQIFFPDQPRDEVRALLRSKGFRWSPSSGAWQCHRSRFAFRKAKEIIEVYGQPAEAASAAN